ncbi:hypothetical protein P4S72_07295 [Vibrio sp. PP-XX7]
MQFSHHRTQEKSSTTFQAVQHRRNADASSKKIRSCTTRFSPQSTLGAPLLALTDNRVISASYHRNIKGNTLATQIFTTTNQAQAKKLLTENKLDYILIGNDNASQHLRKLSPPDSFVNQLANNKPANNQHLDWLQLLARGSQYGTRLYKVHH